MSDDDSPPPRPPDGATESPGPPREGFETGHLRRLLESRLFAVASAPTRIGRYTVLRRLGSGGMGVVYAAYDEDLDRRVAIKLVAQPRRDDADHMAPRVRREAQALGRVTHPNVVAVHEVGDHVADDGTVFVFIAMEFVRGQTLREWLAGAHPWRSIVDVLVHGGRGLAAVHAAGLVHRDVKPENLMIDDASVGSLGRVRLMDFGLARLELDATTVSSDDWLERDGDDPLASPILTRTGALIGTPAYMAPEQQRGGMVNARADQFAWCVMAWEALYGERPFEGATISALFEHVRSGRRREPRSTRGVPARVRRVLERGLEVDPSARWPSMDALLDAIGPGPRRSRTLVATLGLGAGVAAFATLRDDPRASCRDEAEAIAHAWTEPQRDALREQITGSGLAYAQDTWVRVEQGIDGWLARTRDARLRGCAASSWSDALQTAHLRCIADRQRRFAAMLDVFARAQGEHREAMVARATMAVGALPSPEPCAELATLAARVEPPGDAIADEVDALRERARHADALLAAGAYPQAGDEVVALAADARASSYTPVHGEMMLLRARVERALGRFAEAEITLRTGWADALAAGDDELAYRIAVQLVYVIGARLGRHAEGLEWAVHARAELVRSGTPPRLEHMLLSALGTLHEIRGDYDLALQEQRQALALQEQVLPADHPDLAHSLNNIGLAEAQLGRMEPAIVDLEHAIGRYEAAFGPEHPEIADTLNNLGICYEQAGRYDDSERVHLRAMAIRERTFGPVHQEVAVSLNNLGTLYNRRGDYGQALAVYRRGLAIIEATRGPNDRTAAELHNNIGWLHDVRGDYAAALEEYRLALAIDEHNFGSGHPETAFTLTNIGIAYERMKDYEQALGFYRRALAVREAKLGPDHVELADTLVGIGNVYKDMGRYDEAIAQQDRALALITAARGADHVDNATPLGNRGNVRRAMKQYDRALADLDRALALREPVLGPDHPRVAWLRQVRGETLLERGDAAAAVREFEAALAVRSAGELPPAELADTRFALARALPSEDLARARTLARQACEIFRGLPQRAEASRDCAAWLHAHGG